MDGRDRSHPGRADPARIGNPALPAVCIGKQTAAAAAAPGMPTRTAPKATPEALAQTLELAAAELERERGQSV